MQPMSTAPLIEALRQYPVIVKEFLQSIPEAKLHARHGEGFWTIYEHLEHMVLTQEVIHQRLELVRDEERPQIVPFNPDEHHEEVPAGVPVRSVDRLVEEYAGWRRKQLAIIEAASLELWRKSAIHPEYEHQDLESGVDRQRSQRRGGVDIAVALASLRTCPLCTTALIGDGNFGRRPLAGRARGLLRMPARGRFLVAALAAAILALGRTAAAAQAPPPIILFWTAYPEALPHITHVTAFAAGSASKETHARGRSLSKGIMLLKYRDGRAIAEDKTAEELADYWCGARALGFQGIAIDEFGHTDARTDEKMSKALALAKRRDPKLYIAVWHAGRLTPEMVRCYREHADLVMLESYCSTKKHPFRRFAENLDLAREGRIVGKTVFALGINNEDRGPDGSADPWANTPEDLRSQMEWVRRNAPEMPGIAFFASRAGVEIQREADRLAWRIFGERVPLPPHPDGTPRAPAR